ncbi:hypothetical protein NA57DRAFT_56846 [Rhizodiscina lignyota]|uniref:Uncharacterized protein n=1 Tax=Rhizodiscina lignyota TaxID=1504668 RepID=A0A9P4MB02_9PEZI|nr:hypothetical protein NA57DRAFT_56846 [Rhizodiscina lignyota]
MQFTWLGRDSGCSPRQMYDIMHSENLMHCLDLSFLNKRDGLFDQFRGFISMLSVEGFATLLMLAWYWYEGPNISTFVDMLVTSKIASNKQGILDALEIASQWGYVEFDAASHISWIHPLFTLYARIVASSTYSRLIFNSSDRRCHFQRKFAALTMGHLVANGDEYISWPEAPVSGLEYAVRLMCALLSHYADRDRDKNYWSYVILFLATCKDSHQRISGRLMSRGLTYPGIWDDFDLCKQNFIFTLKICRGRGPLPLPSIGWPTSAIVGQAHFVRKVCSAEEIRIIAGYLEELLNGGIAMSKTFSPKDAVQPNDLHDLVSIAASLAEIHRRELPFVERRHMEIVKHALEILEESEAAFGKSTDPQVACSKSLLSIVKATALLENGETAEEAKLEMHKASIEMQKVFATPNPELNSRVEEFLKGKDPEEAKLWKTFMQSFPTSFGSFEDAWDVMAKGTLGEPILELPESIRRNVQNTELNALETEMNKGHWLRAIGIHSGFTLKSIEKLDFEEARRHVDIQADLAKQHDSEGTLLDKTADAKKFINSFEAMTKSFFPDKSPTQATFEAVEEFANATTEMMREHNLDSPEQNEIMEYMRESFVQDSDPALNHNQAPGIFNVTGETHAWMQSLLARHLTKASRSTEYRQRWLRALSRMFRTLRELEHGEDEDDVDKIFQSLNELREMSEDDYYTEFVNKDKIDKRRSWNTERLFRSAIIPLNDMVKTNKFSEAREFLAKAETVAKLGPLNNPQFEKLLPQLPDLVEGQHLLSLGQPAQDALDARDYPGAITMTSQYGSSIVEKEGLCKDIYYMQDFFQALQELDLIMGASRLQGLRDRLEQQKSVRHNGRDTSTPAGHVTESLVHQCGKAAAGVLNRLSTSGAKCAREFASVYVKKVRRSKDALTMPAFFLSVSISFSSFERLVKIVSMISAPHIGGVFAAPRAREDEDEDGSDAFQCVQRYTCQ